MLYSRQLIVLTVVFIQYLSLYKLYLDEKLDNTIVLRLLIFYQHLLCNDTLLRDIIIE
jgi:hypothetical protein